MNQLSGELMRGRIEGMKMTDEAKSALLAAQNRTGAPVRGSRRTVLELEGRGYVSSAGYLTERGKQVRTTIAKQREDEAFG